MSKKRGPYKEYLETGDSPPKSTKYDHAKKRKLLDSDSSDSSSSDDMKKFYDIVHKKSGTIETLYSPTHNSEIVSVGGNNMLDTTACSSVQSHADTIEHIVKNTSEYRESDLEDYETPLSMNDNDNDIDNVPLDCSDLIEGSCTETELNDSLDSQSEDEDKFWLESQPETFCEIKRKLDSGDLDEVIPAKLVVSQAEMLCAILKYSEHFNIPTVGIEHICKMFNSFLDKPALPDTRYSIDQLLRFSDVVEYHAVCIKCNRYLRSFLGSERTVFCNKCKSNIAVKGNNVNFFVILNVKDKVRHLLETNDQYYDTFVNNQNEARENFEDICDGSKYKEFVFSLPDEQKYSYVTCTFNTDGSPVWKSSNYSIWPIQLQINELPKNIRCSKTITSALWFGKNKPDMNIFLKNFARNINAMRTEGISCSINNSIRKIRLYPICCCVDTMARAPLQGIIQFNGSFGCNWCLHPGVSVKHKKKKVIKYPLLDYVPTKRSLHDTLIEMKKLKDKSSVSTSAFGVKRTSPLVRLQHFNIIDGFVPDEMHCISLGVCRQFARSWFDGSNAPYSLKDKITQINDILLKIQTPKQITRLSRSLNDRKNWKAREWENWLLYYSLPILKLMPDFKVYEDHWQLLVEGMHIMKKSFITNYEIDYADKCFKKFVAGTEEHYGQTAMTYNIHQLLHIADSVRNWGPITLHTGYPFESGNGRIIKMIKSTNGVLHQICRKIEYENSAILLEEYIIQKYVNSPALKFIYKLRNRYTENSIEIGENRYFGKSVYAEKKWIDLRNLSKNYSKTYERLFKDDCLFASCNKKALRSNNSYTQTKRGIFVKIVEFIVDEINKLEYTICNYIVTETAFENCDKIQKIVRIEKENIDINTNDITNIAICIDTNDGQYISAVPNMLNY